MLQAHCNMLLIMVVPREDVTRGMATDNSGNTYITGYTSNTSGFATAGASQTAYGGGLYDAFLHKVSYLTPITGNTSVCFGSTTTLSNATAGGTWNSGNTAVATIGSTSGTVTTVSAGTAVITYTISGDITIATVAVNALPTPITGTTVVCTGTTTT